jgi:hypothetical protein
MEYLTTSRLAARLNIQPKELFKKLNDLGWTNGSDGRLTQLGKNKGGQIWSNNEGREYIVWPVNLFDNGSDSKTEQEEISYLDDYEETSEKSEGEDYIAEYFDEIGIEYRRQHVIEKLTDRYAGFRVSDFYLPKYKVMVEFAGRWNRSERERIRYRRKKEVYDENGVPCLWLYPDNLGVLHYMFHKRLESLLGHHRLEKGLLIYRLKQFWASDSANFMGVAIGLWILFDAATPWSENRGTALIGMAMSLYNLYVIVRDLNLIRKGKSIKISRLTKWEE